MVRQEKNPIVESKDLKAIKQGKCVVKKVTKDHILAYYMIHNKVPPSKDIFILDKQHICSHAHRPTFIWHYD